jgi:hypothetical protein
VAGGKKGKKGKKKKIEQKEELRVKRNDEKQGCITPRVRDQA